MVAGVVADEPSLAVDVIFGAAALAKVESRFAHHILRSWDDGASSLRPSLEHALGVGSGAGEPDLAPGPDPSPASHGIDGSMTSAG
jgi:hypothetical protein